MTREALIEALEHLFPCDDLYNIVLVDGFEDAFIGLGDIFGADRRAVYSYDRCIAILVGRDGMDHDEAVEYMDFNVLGAFWRNPMPLFLCSDDFLEGSTNVTTSTAAD